MAGQDTDQHLRSAGAPLGLQLAQQLQLQQQDTPASPVSHCLQNKLEVRADGTADLQLRGMQPLVFVQDAVAPSTFVPQPPAKWPVSGAVVCATSKRVRPAAAPP